MSGRARPKISQSGAAERWRQKEITITLDASLDKLSPAARESVQQAFGAWLSSPAKLPRVTFDSRPHTPVLLEPDGENRVYYTPITVKGHENDLAITLGYSDTESGQILEADIILNERYPFALLEAPAPAPARADPASGESGAAANPKGSGQNRGTNGCGGKYDFESVATHEVGHFWGLGEDMTDTSATMYFSTPPCNVGKRALKADDTEEITKLYLSLEPANGEQDPAAAGAKRCSVSTVGVAPGAEGSVWTAALVAVGALRRRRRG